MGMTKSAWVTGAGRGIGRATALALAREGYDVALTSRNATELAAVAREIEAIGRHAIIAVADVSEAAQVDDAHREIVRAIGDPQVLVNNAGISPWSTFTETTTDEFDRAIAVNLRSLFLCSKLVLPAMYTAGSGAIVQMLSVASVRPYKNGAAYVASKFGAQGFTLALREEARKHGVRVLGVMPGAVETDLWDAEERARSGDRMMQPEEIAAMIVAALNSPERAMVEEMMIRPIGGDI
jgi:3-oxoacyl-[acyl-carrier protein] reductase